jgi:hypothetical protein
MLRWWVSLNFVKGEMVDRSGRYTEAIPSGSWFIRDRWSNMIGSSSYEEKLLSIEHY